jgi:hypothetical protein
MQQVMPKFMLQQQSRMALKGMIEGSMISTGHFVPEKLVQF